MAKKWFKKLGEQVFGDDAMGVGALAGAGMAGVGKGKPDPDIGESAPVKERSLLQRIDFDYQDSPKNHGWQIEGDPSFSILPGGVLDMPLNQRYSMNYDVKPFACAGTSMEFVARRYEADNAAVYARVVIQRQNGSEHKGVWIKFKIGSQLAQPSQDGSQEWVWYMQPTTDSSGWAKFKVDLPDVIEQTFGEGWTYRELKKFRLRGGLKIKHIAVYS